MSHIFTTPPHLVRIAAHTKEKPSRGMFVGLVISQSVSQLGCSSTGSACTIAAADDGMRGFGHGDSRLGSRFGRV